MNEIEAVQCHLPGLGWALIPRNNWPGEIPKVITYEYVRTAMLRFFDEPNTGAPQYIYSRDASMKCFRFHHSIGV